MLEFLSKVDDVRKYIGRMVDNNEIIHKHLPRVQNEWEKENEKVFNSSKSNANLGDRELNLMSFNSNKNLNDVNSANSYINRTPSSKGKGVTLNKPPSSITKSNSQSQNLNINQMVSNLNSLNSGNYLNDENEYKASIPKTTNNNSKGNPNSGIEYKIDPYQYATNSSNINQNSNNLNNPYLNSNKAQSININIINSNINNYVVSMQGKSKTPTYVNVVKKESTPIDDIKNLRAKYTNNENIPNNNLRNSTNTNPSKKGPEPSNISNNNLQKIKLIENIYNEDFGKNNKGNKPINKINNFFCRKSNQQIEIFISSCKKQFTENRKARTE